MQTTGQEGLHGQAEPSFLVYEMEETKPPEAGEIYICDVDVYDMARAVPGIP